MKVVKDSGNKITGIRVRISEACPYYIFMWI